ncbi:hypothetical protein O6H91_03G122900 [Diphasiastrum complanatum]|uniref:Uncharacterized protein n=1 Tax=Diphasiastrum complanatum TaxID=34168 RepID=A0ACC2EBM5_DIPCM|nr:hypothetical protein O6H91_03G122900 [Diphasiastrum complanatum]
MNLFLNVCKSFLPVARKSQFYDSHPFQTVQIFVPLRVRAGAWTVDWTIPSCLAFLMSEGSFNEWPRPKYSPCDHAPAEFTHYMVAPLRVNFRYIKLLSLAYTL